MSLRIHFPGAETDVRKFGKCNVGSASNNMLALEGRLFRLGKFMSHGHEYAIIKNFKFYLFFYKYYFLVLGFSCN